MKTLNWLFILIITTPLFLISFDASTDSHYDLQPFSYVKKREIRPFIQSRGILKPELEIKVHSPVTGTLKTSNLNKGSYINKGDLLVSMENKDLLRSLSKARADREIIQQQLKEFYELTLNEKEIEIVNIREKAAVIMQNSEDALEEGKEGFRLGLISRDEEKKLFRSFEQAKREIEKSHLTIKKIRLSLKREEQQLKTKLEEQELIIQELKKEVDGLNIHAPLNGYISLINQDLPSPVNTKFSRNINKGEFLFTMASDSAFIIKTHIFENDLNAVSKGDIVDVITDTSGEKYNGEVKEIALCPELVGSAMKYQVLISITLKDKQRILGHSVRVIFKTDKNSKVLSVPINCLTYRNGLKYIEVERAGKILPVQITTGIRNNLYIEVLNGLFEGEKIYYQGGEKLLN